MGSQPTASGDFQLVIDEVQPEADGVISIRLVHPGGAELPDWTPGAHIDLVLPSGLVRQYSLCGPRSDRYGYTVAVLRDEAGRGGSLEVHRHAEVGRKLAIRGPRNNFALAPAETYLFVAGGIGITPIRAMIEAAEQQAAGWSLHYGGRTRAHMAFAEALHGRYPEQVILVPQDTNGVLDLQTVIAKAPVDAQVYACGPEPMLSALAAVCDIATNPRTLRVERFTSVKSDDAGQQENSAFEIELRKTGVVLPVPADRSILSVAREAVVGLPFSCEEGVCGACEARVLDGVPEHRDSVLTDDERESNETMMICVGRACSSRLVLDL